MEMRVRSCSRFRSLANFASCAPQCSGHPARELRRLRARALLRPQRPSSHGARLSLSFNAGVLQDSWKGGHYLGEWCLPPHHRLLRGVSVPAIRAPCAPRCQRRAVVSAASAVMFVMRV